MSIAISNERLATVESARKAEPGKNRLTLKGRHGRGQVGEADNHRQPFHFGLRAEPSPGDGVGQARTGSQEAASIALVK